MSRTGELLWWLACAAVGLLLCAWALGLLDDCRGGDGKKRPDYHPALFSWITSDPGSVYRICRCETFHNGRCETC